LTRSADDAGPAPSCPACTDAAVVAVAVAGVVESPLYILCATKD
jgi:hypothetical protein